MTTSGVTTASMTAGQIVATAVGMIGASDPGEVMADDEVRVGLTHLQWMLQSWQADGCPLWREFEDSVAFGRGMTEKTLDPFVIDVHEARIVISNQNERSLSRWEWGEWVTLPNKLSQGTPTVFTLRKAVDTITMRLWPVPSRSYSVKYTGARIIEDVTTASQTLDIPRAWNECVFTNLAVRLIAPYRVSPTPEILELMQRAPRLYASLRDMDRPASVFFARA